MIPELKVNTYLLTKNPNTNGFILLYRDTNGVTHQETISFHQLTKQSLMMTIDLKIIAYKRNIAIETMASQGYVKKDEGDLSREILRATPGEVYITEKFYKAKPGEVKAAINLPGGSIHEEIIKPHQNFEEEIAKISSLNSLNHSDKVSFFEDYDSFESQPPYRNRCCVAINPSNSKELICRFADSQMSKNYIEIHVANDENSFAEIDKLLKKSPAQRREILLEAPIAEFTADGVFINETPSSEEALALFSAKIPYLIAQDTHDSGKLICIFKDVNNMVKWKPLSFDEDFHTQIDAIIAQQAALDMDIADKKIFLISTQNLNELKGAFAGEFFEESNFTFTSLDSSQECCYVPATVFQMTDKNLKTPLHKLEKYPFLIPILEQIPSEKVCEMLYQVDSKGNTPLHYLDALKALIPVLKTLPKDNFELVENNDGISVLQDPKFLQELVPILENMSTKRLTELLMAYENNNYSPPLHRPECLKILMPFLKKIAADPDCDFEALLKLKNARGTRCFESLENFQILAPIWEMDNMKWTSLFITDSRVLLEKNWLAELLPLCKNYESLKTLVQNMDKTKHPQTGLKPWQNLDTGLLLYEQTLSKLDTFSAGIQDSSPEGAFVRRLHSDLKVQIRTWEIRGTSYKYDVPFLTIPDPKQLIDISMRKRGIKDIADHHLTQLVKNLETALKYYEDPKMEVVFLKNDGTREIGTDRGGLSRDFLDELSRGITEFPNLRFHQIEENGLKIPLTIAEASSENRSPSLNSQEKDLYQNLGKLMMYCYHSKSKAHFDLTYLLGRHFDDAIFKAALSLNSDEIDTPFEKLPIETKFNMCEDLLKMRSGSANYINLLNATRKLWMAKDKKLMGAVEFVDQMGFLPEDLDLKNDLDEFDIVKIKAHRMTILNSLCDQLFTAGGEHGVLGRELAPIHALAQGLKAFSQPTIPSSAASSAAQINTRWNAQFLNMDVVEFSSKVQGTLDRETIVKQMVVCAELMTDREKREITKKMKWLQEWIKDEASEMELQNLLRFLTGSSSLPAGKQIKIIKQVEEEKYNPIPHVHTCSLTIEICPIPIGNEYNDRDKENFIRCLKEFPLKDPSSYQTP